MNAPYEIKAAEYLGDFRLRLIFADGLVGDVDLADRLSGEDGPVLAPLKDQAYFAQVRVDNELGTVVWPNGADLAPDALHERAVHAAWLQDRIAGMTASEVDSVEAIRRLRNDERY